MDVKKGEGSLYLLKIYQPESYYPIIRSKYDKFSDLKNKCDGSKSLELTKPL